MQVHELGQCCVQIVLIYMFKYFVNVLKRYYHSNVVWYTVSHCTVHAQLQFVVYFSETTGSHTYVTVAHRLPTARTPPR